MDHGRVERLTEAQRECLRRVLQHMTSKDIARELGISPHTVDQRLRIAARTLGVASRIEAARLLAEYEELGPEAYQPAAYQSPHIADSLASASFPHISAGDRFHDQPAGEHVRERQLAYQAFVPEPQRLVALPFPTRAGEENKLKAGQRVGWIVGIAILSALSFGAVLAGLDSLGSLLRG